MNHLLICYSITLAWPQNADSEKIRSPFLFRSYHHPASDQPNERNPGPPCKKEIWKVARAATAAPSYFRPMELEGGPFLDGGLGANNPTTEAWYSIRQRHEDRDAVQVLVSIGTGQDLRNRRTVTSFYHRILRVSKTMKAMATDTERVHEEMERSMIEGQGRGRYYRLNVEKGLGDRIVPLDACKGIRGSKTLDILRMKTNEYLESSQAKSNIRKIAEQLVAIRRARSNSLDQDSWEEFCYGLKYKCTVPKCVDLAERFQQRLNLKDHLARRHPELRTSEDALLDAGKCYSVEVRE